MAAPTRRSSVPAAQGSGSSVTITKPTGTAANDILYMVIALSADASTPTTNISWPSGFTEVDGHNENNIIAIYSAWKLATGSEPANYTATIRDNYPTSPAAYSDDYIGWMFAVTGADTTTPIPATDHSASGGASASAMVAGSITPDQAESLVIVAYTSHDKNNAHSTPTSYAEIDELSQGAGGPGNWITASICDRTLTSSSAQNPSSAASDTANRYAAVIAAFQPPSSSDREAHMSWAEMEAPNAPREAHMSWAELEVPSAPREAHMSWAELEIPNAAREAHVSWAEMETTDPPREAHVSWAEMEAPGAPRQAEMSWTELEIPNAAREAHMSWTELELPDAPLNAQVSWAEMELPNAPREAHMSWTELEVPNAPREAHLSWTELEIPNAAREAHMSWAEVELPNAPREAHVSFAELELPNAPREAHVSWAEMEVADAPVAAQAWEYDMQLTNA